MTHKPTLLILAAGMGSRYGSLKQIDQLGPSGETIMDYSVYDAVNAGFDKVVFVIRKNLEKDFHVLFDRYSKKINVDYVFQELDNLPSGLSVPANREKPWGTGHAIMVAAEKITNPFAVINADDFYGTHSFNTIAKHLVRKEIDDKNRYSMVGFVLENTLSEFGYVSRGVCNVNMQGSLESITERTKIQKNDDDSIFFIDEEGKEKYLTGKEIVSMNFWGFPVSIFHELQLKFEAFIKNNINNPKAEFYIPFAVNDLIQDNIANVKVLTSQDNWFGVTYKEDRPATVERLNQLVKAGIYPQKLW